MNCTCSRQQFASWWTKQSERCRSQCAGLIGKSLKVDGVRWVHVDGTRAAQANIGFACSYSGNGFVLVGAAQLPRLKPGTDYSISNRKFAPLLELNTLQKAKAATGSGCSIGSLTPESEIIVYNPACSQSVIFTNGQTCLSQSPAGPVVPP